MGAPPGSTIRISGLAGPDLVLVPAPDGSFQVSGQVGGTVQFRVYDPLGNLIAGADFEP